MTGRRALLLAVAALLTASAALAIAILLFGDFGQTEGKILATTALLAAYGLLALPGPILIDQRRLRPLAVVLLALAAVAAAVSIAAVWLEDAPEALGKTVATVLAFLIAATQTAALAARLRRREPALVRALFAASTAVALTGATSVAVVIWAELDSELYARAVAALVVLDLLLVALQPILGRARPVTEPTRLRLGLTTGADLDVTADAPDVAAAVAQAIAAAERNGRRVTRVEILSRPPSSP